MFTVSETEIFQRYAQEVWTEDERTAFVNWIAVNCWPGMSFQAPTGAERFAGPGAAWVKEGFATVQLKPGVLGITLE